MLPIWVRVDVRAMAITFRKAGTSPSDDLMSYLGHSLPVAWSYPSVEIQPVYSTAPDNWRCRGVMVIVVGNGHGDTSSNSGRG